MEKLYTVSKNWLGADCGSDHELLIAKFRLKLQKIGKTTRPFRYDLNQFIYILLITSWGSDLDYIEFIGEGGRNWHLDKSGMWNIFDTLGMWNIFSFI